MRKRLIIISLTLLIAVAVGFVVSFETGALANLSCGPDILTYERVGQAMVPTITKNC